MSGQHEPDEPVRDEREAAAGRSPRLAGRLRDIAPNAPAPQPPHPLRAHDVEALIAKEVG